jgi:hypothetical protein
VPPGHLPPGYRRGSFLHGGRVYVPLRDIGDLIGAALLWDQLKGCAVITYGGKDLALDIGSPVAVHAGRRVRIAASPMAVEGRTFVPAAVLRDQLGLPVERDGRHSKLKIKCREGWESLEVISEVLRE